MAEKIGLIAVLDLKQFNRAYRTYISKLNTMNQTTGRTAKGLSGQFVGLGQSLLKVAAILSGAVVAAAALAGIALAKFASQSINEAADLEQQIANIASVMNSTAGEVGFLKDVIIDLGLDPQLRVTTFEAAEAMELLAKNGIFAGLSVSEMEATAREAGKAVVLLSNATGAEFGQAANIATDAMVLFNRDASELVDIVSGITSVTTNSKFTINDYELALRNGGAAVAQYGVSLEDFNTMVTLSAEELGTGMKAGTGWLNFMNRLTPNTEKAKNIMQDLGIVTADGTNRFFDATGELKDMSEVAEILNQALFGTTQVVGEVGGRTLEQQTLLMDLNAEYRDAEQTIYDYTQGIDGLLASEEEKNAAIEEAESIMSALAPKMAELNDIRGDLITTNQKLTSEERAVAVETLFGNDGMKSAIALAKEGAVVTSDHAAVMRAFGVTHEEAYNMMAEGLTKFQLLQAQQEQTDAVENAATRMDTLRGKVEILGGVFEAVRIRFGDPFVEFLGGMAQKALDWIDGQDDLIAGVGLFADALVGMFEAMVNGDGAIKALAGFFDEIGRADLSVKLFELEQSFKNFITPIIEFVSEHKDAFIGAIQGIGAVLAGSMIAAILAGIGSAIMALLSPVGLLIIAAGALGAAWKTNFGDIQGITQRAVKKIKGFLDTIGILDFMQTLKDAFDSDGLKGVVDALPDAFSGLGETIGDLLSGIDWLQVGIDIRTKLFEGMSNLGSMAGQGINFIVEWLSNVNWEEVGKTLVDLFISAWILQLVVMETMYEALFNFMRSLVLGIDWLALGTTLLDMFAGLFTGIGERLTTIKDTVIPIIKLALAGMINSINEWFQEQRANAITWAVDNIVFPILEGLATLAEDVKVTLAGWWNTFYTWVTSITWEDIGYWVTTALLTIWFAFPAKILLTLSEWWTTFTTWFESKDWKKLATDVVKKLLVELATFVLKVISTLDTWYKAITSWFDDQDWEAHAKTVVDRIKEEWTNFWDNVSEKFEEFKAKLVKWWGEQDWKKLATDTIDGLVQGFQEGIGELVAAVQGLAAGAKAAWDDFWQTESPSKVMIESGKDIMAGVALGVRNGFSGVVDAFGNITTFIKTVFLKDLKDTFSEVEDIFDFGSGLSGFAGGFGTEFTNRVLNPMKEKIAELESERERRRESLGNFGLPSDLTALDLKLLSEGQSVLGVDPSRNLINNAKRLLEIQNEISFAKREAREEEERMLLLQQKQADFAFLQQQMDFLRFIDEQGLNAADILGGLELGLNADIGAIVDAMNRAMTAIIMTANDELGIQSPSTVFKGIGQQVIEGLRIGLTSGTDMLSGAVRNTVGGFIGGIEQNLPRVPTVTPTNTTNQTVNNFELNNNFTGEPQITDVDGLRLTLAGFT